ncbi:MAG: thiopeptide-type bacteriocin biosynthesis protein [Muribaculum sp.]|nr:thiopeptide-type bacteriocin biosynthesis protein [Muribaculum sp.]
MANYLLTERIGPLVNKWTDEGLIDKWFFIRYSDTGHHIRLRTRLINLDNIGILITELRIHLTEELNNGTVSSIQLDSYQRELERYGVSNIEKCESFFFEDSCKALDIIQRKKEDIELIRHSVIWILNLLVSLGITDKQICEYLNEMEDGYQREFRLSTHQVKLINDAYRRFSREILRQALELCCQPRVTAEKVTWIVASDVSPHLLSSLVHMHINRLFAMNQRLYEYIVYHMANKVFESVEKRMVV